MTPLEVTILDGFGKRVNPCSTVSLNPIQSYQQNKQHLIHVNSKLIMVHLGISQQITCSMQKVSFKQTAAPKEAHLKQPCSILETSMNKPCISFEAPLKNP